MSRQVKDRRWRDPWIRLLLKEDGGATENAVKVKLLEERVRELEEKVRE